MADDTKKADATKAPTQVVGPAGRTAQASPDQAPAPLEQTVNPARTGVADREIKAAPSAATVPPMPPEAAQKIDRAAEIRANFGKAPELLEADRLEREAQDALAAELAKAQEARGDILDTTVAEAKFAAAPLVGGDMSAGAHVAQKFGNDPRNPKEAPGLDPANRTVLLSRKTPDHPDFVYTRVNPEMVGDYERAGWNRAV